MLHRLNNSRQPLSTQQWSHPHSHLYMPPLPQPVVTPPTPASHSPSHWLRHFPTTTPSVINTPHVPSQSFFNHLPMKKEPIDGSETSAIRTKIPWNYPKETYYIKNLWTIPKLITFFLLFIQQNTPCPYFKFKISASGLCGIRLHIFTTINNVLIPR